MSSARNRTESHALTPKQDRAVGLLLAGKSGTEAAAEVGVRRETVSRWRKLPAFAAALAEGRAALVEYRREVTAALIDDSLRVVREAVGGGDVPTAARVILAPHLAPFAGGAEPGATRVEHSGNVSLPALRVEFVGLDDDAA